MYPITKAIKTLLLAVASTSALFAAPIANASFIALDSTRTTGNQGWNGSLGMNFDVLSAINVTQLGAFDSGQDGFTSEIRVGIFDRNTSALVTEVALFNGLSSPLIGQSRFFDIIDVVLNPGNYAIVAQGFDAGNQNGNAGATGPAPNIDTGGGSIQFVDGGFYGTAPLLDYPSNADAGPANRYDAGTFQFESASAAPVPVPTPPAVLLFGSGLLGLWGMRRKVNLTV